MDMAGFQSAPSCGLSLSRSILLSSTFLAFSKFRFSFFLMVSILMLSYPVQSRGTNCKGKNPAPSLWPFGNCTSLFSFVVASAFTYVFSSGFAFSSVNDFMNLPLGVFEFHLIRPRGRPEHQPRSQALSPRSGLILSTFFGSNLVICKMMRPGLRSSCS